MHYLWALVFITVAQCTVRLGYLNYHQPNEIIDLNKQNVRQLRWDRTIPVKILIHGWQESSDKDYYTLLTLNYFVKGPHHIIQVDYRQLANNFYPASARESVGVGIIVGEIIETIHRFHHVSLEQFHLLGHSLGAHVASYASQYVRNQTRGGLIGRITGLNAAALLFQFPFAINNHGRLTHADARMVDILHTDSGVVGHPRSEGTVDFYANSGVRPQPSCRSINFFTFGPWEYFFCSHQVGVMYFAESINSRDFIAVKCESYSKFMNDGCRDNERIVFGEQMPLNASGSYFFNTNTRRPFAQLYKP